MNIRILPEDALMSRYIRKRDGRCSRCYSPVRYNGNGDPISHTNSHYFTRGNWATRMEGKNCTTLCFPCHQKWGGDEREEYTKFMKKWLGTKGFQKLVLQSNEYANKRKIREWAKVFYKQAYKEL